MTSTYALVLAAESLVVAASGLVIAAVAARNPDVVLYSTAVGVVGLGLAAGGTGSALAVLGWRLPATGLFAVAAIAYVLAGWRIATDDVDTRTAYEVTPPEPNDYGFEEEP